MTCTTIKNIWDCGKNCGVSSPYLLYRTTQGSKPTAGVFVLERMVFFVQTPPICPERGFGSLPQLKSLPRREIP